MQEAVVALQYEVIRSPKRRKTVQARLVDGVLQLSIPARMSKTEEQHWINEMVARFERKRSTEPIDLAARAELLATRYRLQQPLSIRWVDNQEWRWGSCTPSERTIRISAKLAAFPGWVLDYVIVHELAHLSVGPHNTEFWEIVDRFPKTERARGFLIAKGLDEAEGEGRPSPPRPRPRPRRVFENGRDDQPTLW